MYLNDTFQIDLAELRVMDDKELTYFIPQDGNRVALLSYIKKEDDQKNNNQKWHW